MLKFPIRLETMKDINHFVSICATCSGAVKLADNEGHCVNGKSMLGVIYSLEFHTLYCLCDADVASKFDDFRI